MDHRYTGGSALRVAEIVRAASFLVSCARCGRLHKPECPLESNPVCPACTGRYALASAQMSEAHRLDTEEIDAEITRRSPGNYALGYLDAATFLAFYVGRSDSDVNQRLHRWVGAESQGTRFAPAGRAAWGSRRRRLVPLPAPLLRPVGIVVEGRYTHFEFSYAPSARAAFEKECRNYHDFGGSYGLDNERHPAAPEGVSWRCPVNGRRCH
jgi:hypothetical protein